MRVFLPCKALLGFQFAIGVCITTSILCNGEASDTSQTDRELKVDRYGDPIPRNAIARLGTVRLHNPEEVNSLVFSKDGRLIVSGVECLGRTNIDQPLHSIWIWERRTGKLVRRIGNARTRVHKLCLSSDGKTLISSEDQGIYLWDMATGNFICHLDTGKKNELASVALSGDGMTLALTGHDPERSAHEIQIWDMQKIKRIRSFDGGDEPIDIHELSPDGKLLATAPYLPTAIKVWNLSTGKSIYQFKTNSHTHIRFSPDGKLIAAEDEQGAIQFRESKSGRPIRLSKHFQVRKEKWDGTSPFAFSPIGKRLAMVTGDGSIRLCDMSTGKTIWLHKYYTTWTTALAFSPDGKFLAGGTDNGWVRIWDVSTGKEVPSFAGHQNAVWSVAYVRDGGLVSASLDSTVRFWNAKSGHEIKVLPRMADEARTVASSPNGKKIAAGGVDGVIRLVEWPSGKLIRLLRGESGYTGLSFSPDGKILAADGIDGQIILWDTYTAKQLCRLKRPSKSNSANFNSLSFSPDGRLLATVTDSDSSIDIWEVSTKKFIRRMRGHKDKDAITGVIFTPNGKELISAGRDRTIRLWNVQTGQERAQFPLDPDHPPEITALALAPDGRVLASAEEGFDGIIVRVWEVASRREICHFHGHTDEITTLSFSPDGRYVASGSRDCTILIWDPFDLKRGRKQTTHKITSKKLEELWLDLRDKDIRVAYHAIRDMTMASDEAVMFIRKRLSPVHANTPEELRKWLKELDSDDFKIRENAFSALEAAGEMAKPVLQAALTDRPSLELRLRVERLLKMLRNIQSSPTRLQQGRALSILELMRNRNAKETLAIIARGNPRAWLTQEAKASLRRLKH